MQNCYFGNKITLYWKDFSQWLILTGIVLGKYGELLTLLLFLCISIFHFKRFYPITKAAIILFTIGIVSFIQITRNSYEYDKFFQQILLISTYTICYIQFFQYHKENLHSLWDKFLKISYFICIVGLIQFIIFYFTLVDIFDNGFGGYGRFIRIHSFFQEAGNLATYLTPCVVYVISSPEYRKKKRKESYILVLTYLLTFTTIAYFIGLLIIIYKLYTKCKWLKYVFLFPIIFLFIQFFESSQNKDYNNQNIINVMQLKFTQSIAAFENFSPYEFELLNASSYATLTNLWIAVNAPNRVIGTGLGTHEISYEKLYKSDYRLYGLNKDDAYSLFTRIFSEFGFIGIILFVLYLIKFYKRNNMISLSLLFLFLSVGIRGGHYTLYGIIFFFFFYMYNAKNYIK